MLAPIAMSTKFTLFVVALCQHLVIGEFDDVNGSVQRREDFEGSPPTLKTKYKLANGFGGSNAPK